VKGECIETLPCKWKEEGEERLGNGCQQGGLLKRIRKNQKESKRIKKESERIKKNQKRIKTNQKESHMLREENHTA
jgi:hypothetical protein